MQPPCRWHAWCKQSLVDDLARTKQVRTLPKPFAIGGLIAGCQAKQFVDHLVERLGGVYVDCSGRFFVAPIQLERIKPIDPS